jgi:rhomboid protease GluP
MDEPACPYCGLSRPGSWWKNKFLNLFFLNAYSITKTLIIVNVALYVISVLLSNSALNSFFSPSNNILLLMGATGTIPINRLNRWWSLLSAGYLHGSIMHIGFNMFALAQIGPLVLQEYGFNRMVILYTLGSIFGFLVSYIAGVPFTIGASAGLCALIGSILYYGKSRGGYYGQALFRQLFGWVIGLFLFGFLVPGINNWGHGGGIAGGIILGFMLGYNEKAPESYFHRFLAMVCIIGTSLVLLWAVLSTFYYLFFVQ